MIYRITMIALAITLTLLIFVPAYAQKVEPEGAIKNDTKDLKLKAPDSGLPMLEQLSEKGIYRVLLKWPEVTLNPQGAMQVEIDFINASAPKPTAEDIPQLESNISGEGTNDSSGFNTPGIMEATIPVDSYDMTIRTEDGKELWKKVDQPGGGRVTQAIQFDSNYTGPITIEISNIKPGWDTGSTTTASDMTDSVKFAATLVPEFPFAAIILVMSIAIFIGASRWSRINR